MKRPVFKPTRFEMQFIGILHRILKSACFNICMIILGFVAGFGSVLSIVHFHAITNSNYECIARIEKVIDELNEMDISRIQKEQEINELLTMFKYRIVHDDLFFEPKIFSHSTSTNKFSRK